MTYKLMLIKIDHRSTEAVKVQSVLTKYGCNIKVRLGLHEVSNNFCSISELMGAERWPCLGLHEVSNNFCSNDGLIVLEVEGEPQVLNEMLQELNSIEYVKAQLLEV